MKTVHFTPDSTDEVADNGYFSSSESSMSEEAMAIMMKKFQPKMAAKKGSTEKEESTKRLKSGKQQTVSLNAPLNYAMASRELIMNYMKQYFDANYLESESNTSEHRLAGTSMSKHSTQSKKSAPSQGTKSNRANTPDIDARKDRVRHLQTYIVLNI